MAITVKDIHEKVFSKQVRGYSVDEVDDFLDELAAQIESLIRENRNLMTQLDELKAAGTSDTVPVVAPAPVVAPVIVPQAPMATQGVSADETQYFKNLESTLHDTLMNAQRIADDTVAEARKKANALVAAAEEQAAAITSAAKAEGEAIRAETEDVRSSMADYRTRFLRLIEEQVRALKADESIFKDM